MVTAGTLYKRRLFDTPAKLDLVERLLLSMAKQNGWQLEAWAVFSNHYHFVARGHQHSVNLGQFIHDFHYESARQLNAMASQPGRRVWYNFRDKRLTYHYSYLARLNYVHRNAVKHGLVPLASQYAWCSAA
jgi:putative transposase